MPRRHGLTRRHGFYFPDAEAPDRTVLIKDPTALKVFYDPRRFRIIRALMKPRAVRELAGKLGTSPHSLYHHLRALERHGFITVAAHRTSGNHVERIYGLASRRFALAPGVDPSAMTGPTEVFVQELRDAVARITRESSPMRFQATGQVFAQAVEEVRLSRTQAIEFGVQIEHLVNQVLAADDPNGEPYLLLGALGPLARSQGTPKTSRPRRRRS